MKFDKKNINQNKLKTYSFVFFMLIYPMLLFCIFYIGVNLNSIAMAFKSISITGEETFVWFANFGSFIEKLVSDDTYVRVSFINSIKMYVLCLVISMPLYIFFSYILYKKCFGHRVWRAIVMVPSILSGFIMCLVFKKFATMGIPAMARSLFGAETFPNLLTDPQYSFGTNIFYMIWTSFSTSLIVYPNAMKEIDDEIIEAAAMDGVDNMFSELYHIILPLIFPTLSTFLITGFAAILSNGGVTATFYMYDAPMEVHNMGYYYWKNVAQSSSFNGYPELAAGGLLMTLIVAPLTILLKTLLEKFGPSCDY